MNHITRFAVGSLATLALLSTATFSAYAVTSAPSLGGAAKFVALGGAGVTCTKSTVGLGAVGSKLTVTRTPTCSIAGAIHQGDATAVNAFNDFLTAYTALKAKTCHPANNLTGQALGGKTLAPGVYCFNKRAGLTTGILTLAGPSSGIWVFQVGTGLTTATSQVVMAGGGQACNVYWVTGTAGTIGTGSKFKGNILAGSAVNFTGSNSSLVGRALAQTKVALSGTQVRLPSNWDTSTCGR
jgi:Ice-binding-like